MSKSVQNVSISSKGTQLTNSFGDSFRKRRLWLDSYIAVEDVKRRKISNNIYERKHSLKYFLPLGLEKSHVCKSMFLSTLWLKSDGIITGFISAKTNADEGIQSILKDNRGISTPTNKKNVEIIKEHISSYQPKVSHYASENAPNRRYLDSCLTVKSMGCSIKTQKRHLSTLFSSFPKWKHRIFEAKPGWMRHEFSVEFEIKPVTADV